MTHLPFRLVTEPPSSPDRARIRRLPELAVTDRAEIFELLDRACVAHVGFVEDARPIVIPTLYVRRGEDLVLHGSVASRLVRQVRGGQPVCVTVTEVDGLVLARSAFETSMNYRSVVVFGTGREVTDPQDRLEALEALSEAVLPGRWNDVRQPSDSELRQTMVVAVRIEQCAAKVSAGHPEDPPEDVELDVWAGRVPLRRVAGLPEPAPDLRSGVGLPGYLREWVERNG